MKHLLVVASLFATAPAHATELIKIYRDPSCGCCTSYAEYLTDHGYDVTIIDDENVPERAEAAGVPEGGLSCHHSAVGGYGVHGHVPAEIIDRLLARRPDVAGIVLPGMPENSPDMAPEKYGTLKVFSYGPKGVALFSDE
ncbi:DUF411 domain-containing protein [Tropicimonas sp. TH_r6]|uniref:DUF411 domain-containing protein n=1 Tax=Tropicimonas sp. TH_r6 TaxID=3082085 RepID=UPI00295389C2|nr:DUF411 domain-containing protein [Tropicimonas sp. TH_r6]MDV7144146.1 DUF411 domain-containing protein [Tropicimonas sp. TH_r6]